MVDVKSSAMYSIGGIMGVIFTPEYFNIVEVVILWTVIFAMTIVIDILQMMVTR